MKRDKFLRIETMINDIERKMKTGENLKGLKGDDFPLNHRWIERGHREVCGCISLSLSHVRSPDF